MTVSVPTNLVRTFAGDGVTTAFVYPIRFDADGELVVILRSAGGVDTVQTLSTHYTVSGEGTASGTVTFLTAPASGVTVVIYRATAETQVVDLEDSARNPAEAVELQLDRTVRMIQDHAAQLSRSVSMRPGSAGITFPEPDANTFIGWNGDGTGLVNKTAADIGAETFPLVADTVLVRNSDNTAFEAKPAGATGLAVLAGETVENVRDIIHLSPKANRLSPLQTRFGAKDSTSNPSFNSSPGWTACMKEAFLTGAQVIVDAPLDLYGGHKIPFGVRIEWENGAWTRQKKRSVSGAFLLTSGAPAYDDPNWTPLADRKDITLINPHIDGADYPLFEGTVVSAADVNNIVLDASAPTIDDYFNGDIIEITTGTASGLGTWAYIIDYDGASRTVVIDQTRTPGIGWGGVPVNGDQVRIGYNDPAFVMGLGARNTQIIGGRIKNFPWERDVAYGYGAKAINLEQGHSRCLIDGLSIENCGIGIFLWGRIGTWSAASDPEEPSREDRQILLSNIITDGVGSPLTAIGTTTAPGPDGDPLQMSVLAHGWSVRNAGHNPNRLFDAGDTKMKSGIINLGGAQNLSIRNWKIQNDATYPETSPGYPSEPNASAFGLTGPVGAVFWGWGRNINASGIEFHGNCDQLVRIQRPRALNIDAGDTNILHSERFDIDGLKHYGTADYVAEVDPDDAFQIARTYLTGTWKITPDVLTNGLIGPNLGGNDFNGFPYDFLNIEFGKHGSQAVVTGTPERHFTLSNDLDTGRTTNFWHKGQSVQYDRIRTAHLNGLSFTTADDGLTAYALPAQAGFVMISSATAGLRMLFSYRTKDPAGSSAPDVIPIDIGVSTTLTTGVLTAGSGADGQFHAAVSGGGSLTVSNRRGASVLWNVQVFGLT